MKPANPSTKPRILVAPLDWGLGHTTRCIPLICELLTCGVTVLLAAEGAGAILLRTVFPHLEILPLPGYRVRYSTTAWRTAAALLAQLPRLQRAIRAETAWLNTAVDTHHIDAVISDNRYGLHHPAVFCVFITHQLQVQTGTRLGNRLLQKKLYTYINRFNTCWIPDWEGAPNLAGALSHPQKPPAVPLHYVGPLSRFEAQPPVLSQYLLILLSGPEPQRTQLEDLLFKQAKLFKNPILIVRGLPANAGVPKLPYHLLMVNHLPVATLQAAIAQASFVISRPGYSTVMDMARLEKKCIFIPTPGQTEQQYLGRYLMQQNRALTVAQSKFSLAAAVRLAETFPYNLPAEPQSDKLKMMVKQVLAKLAGVPQP